MVLNYPPRHLRYCQNVITLSATPPSKQRFSTNTNKTHLSRHQSLPTSPTSSPPPALTTPYPAPSNPAPPPPPALPNPVHTATANSAPTQHVSCTTPSSSTTTRTATKQHRPSHPTHLRADHLLPRSAAVVGWQAVRGELALLKRGGGVVSGEEGWWV